ncbi:hypothetical protein Bca52824_095033 [Brassica carinata]|uniref:Retrotransposon gag domain-containing protein n=1 Tax=Brassica carinata TaxID=52824 RepID=A0A8X7TK61_BRACI|nr:hypothetical protein Bca52824_095033 [Brassica carinata]
MKQGDSSVREYNASFAAMGLTNNPDQGMLVKMYRDGLKEDIRVASDQRSSRPSRTLCRQQ